MTDEITTGDVEPVQNTTEEINNTSVEEFTQRRLGGNEEEQSENVEAQENSEESVPQSEEAVLSQLDMDNLSEGELKELADKLGSRAVARFGEMTARRKAAEERAAALEVQLQNQKQSQIPSKEIKDNPFGDLENIQDIQSKTEEIDSTIEWAEDILFESDSYAADDVVTEIDGKEVTKKEVRKALLNARKAQKTFLPDQLNKVNERESGKRLQVSFDTKARRELPWLNGEDNATRQAFVATMRDPRYAKLKTYLNKESPGLSSQLEYWFAHATNSMYGRQPISETPTKQVTKTGKAPSINPTKTGNSGVAKSDKPTSQTTKVLKDLQSRFKNTGSPRDYAEMRRQQIQNR